MSFTVQKKKAPLWSSSGQKTGNFTCMFPKIEFLLLETIMLPYMILFYTRPTLRIFIREYIRDQETALPELIALW